ncbi:acyl-CoA carboxylase subunit beta [Parahaliea mediterranea]|uniref:Acyl-CoA carboxylase subunit beta n=1 Tax=Parahaliea mediterranea TaxID=651086 RepID=A0A939DH44_9GAMM|nr:carboxyl transferase domain-containing protein [Parahaliea mediterranea]MBN7797938.1 acyl-CoA carboxylase subunit beta [Parahaliea mediterranea]
MTQSAPVFHSRVNTGSEAFDGNRADMQALVDKLNGLCARAAALSDRARPRFDKRGQLLPRERLGRLLDPGAPFLELCNLTGYLVDTDDPESSVPGSNAICGIGYVSGVRCMVVVDDSGINAGAMTAFSSRKVMRCMDIALDKKLPFVHLVESAGADLFKYQVEMWMDGGGVFARLARLSAAGIPTVTVLHGLSVAGGAYMPGLSDYVIGVRDNGMAALAGPALLKAATGEVAENGPLGGAAMHAATSGLVEYLAEDDGHALAICRDVVASLGWNRHCPQAPDGDFEEPRYSPDELLGVVPADYRQPYDAREVVARLVDGSRFLDFKPAYGVSMVCLQASIYGMPVGILCNNGPIDPDGATKAAQFIQLCDQAGTPLLFLQNITGYMVGTAYEQAGMIKHGSKMIQAVTNARVPRLTLMIGASFGAGNYGMCGQGYDPDFVFSWPNTQIGVMGGEQAANTMSEVLRAGAARKGVEVDEAELKAREQAVIGHYDRQSDAFYTSGRMLDDGLIDPRDSRTVLGILLQICREARDRGTHPNTFGVGRM